MALSDKQQAFVEAYLANGFNATQAAITAGYSARTAASQGQRLLKNVEIRAEIDRRMSAQVMEADEALKSMSQMARFNPDDFFTIPGVFPYFDYEKARERGVLHMLKKVKVRGDGGIEVEWYGRQRSVETMMRHHGLLKDGNTFNFNLTVNVELLFEAAQALEEAGIDATEFFTKAIARARERKHTLAGG